MAKNPEFGTLTEGSRVKINYVYASPSVLFTKQWGLIICSAYTHQLYDCERSSLGGIKKEMAEFANIDLNPAINTLAAQAAANSTSSSNNSNNRAEVGLIWKCDSTPPAGKIECDAIALVLLPESWSRPVGSEGALSGDPTEPLRELYVNIRRLLEQLKPKALAMVAVGRSMRFALEIVAQELLSLASFISDSNIPSLKQVTLATNKESTLSTYKALFSQSGYRDSIRADQLPTVAAELTQLLPHTAAVPELSVPGGVHDKFQKVVSGMQIALLSNPELCPSLRQLLDSLTAAEQSAVDDLQVWIEAMPGCRDYLIAVHRAAREIPAAQRAYLVASSCCLNTRLVLEASLKCMVQVNMRACEQAWQQQQQQQQQGQSSSVVRSVTDFSKPQLTAGVLMSLLSAAAQTDARIAAVYNEKVQTLCATMQHTGNKAAHNTDHGEVTIADANMGLWALKQLVSTLVGFFSSGHTDA